MTVIETTPVVATTTTRISVVENDIIRFLSNRNIHKLAGTAVSIIGLTGLSSQAGKYEAILGAAYAAIMHVAGAIKKLPD